MNSLIFNIQKFCINDGPGIRTTVFFKGCPLNCLWCHNPESKSALPELFYNKSKCVLCGKCQSVCPNGAHEFFNNTHTVNRVACTVCGNCASACVTDALEVVGYSKSASEILSEVLKDEVFYNNSGGGITLSGGEPMQSFDFVYELLSLAKEKKLHVCMETCGFASCDKYLKILPLVDIFLFDYKETSSEKHKKFTGVANTQILKNLFLLDNAGASIILRCPIIPSLNDTEEHFEGIARAANALHNILEINIEPYHPLGSGKSTFLGKDYALGALTFPDEKTVEGWIQSIQSKTKIKVKKA